MLLFDLDNTLYPPERELFSLIDVRINRYMCEVVGIPVAEVDGLRRRYWAEYGVTLQGLIRHYQVDPEDYLDYVHDVDVASRLDPDAELRLALEQLPQRKVIFTNGSTDHAERVLARLGLRDQFERIFDIRVARYQPKPFAAPYHQVVAELEVAPGDCTMIEDSLENLRTAKALGMKTVLVGAGPEADFVDARIDRAAQVPAALVGLHALSVPF
ncbi:pyrimidine 5'-nucleotidase [Trichloromonas sp.]|uniref:pyrimidine 5'-nucleotidase n=1 Tax=Trichloromonas sp. TaxID=3069249 RepID=UPI002A3C043D|nr:pyrimidine 5'-nucleotidase [Trichloromonas sp.]